MFAAAVPDKGVEGRNFPDAVAPLLSSSLVVSPMLAPRTDVPRFSSPPASPPGANPLAATPAPTAAEAAPTPLDLDGTRPMTRRPEAIASADLADTLAVAGPTTDPGDPPFAAFGDGGSGTGNGSGAGYGSGTGNGSCSHSPCDSDDDPLEPLGLSGGAPGLTIPDSNDKSQWTIPDGVPVGTIISLTVTPGENAGLIDIPTVQWNLGEGDAAPTVSSYIDPAIGYSDTAPTTAEATEDIQTAGVETLTFVVDARAREYTITVTAMLQGTAEAPPAATLTFESHRPEIARIEPDLERMEGVNPYYRLTKNNSYVEVALTNTEGDRGMAIRSETKANSKFGGSFAYLQIAEIYRDSSYRDGSSYRIRNIVLLLQFRRWLDVNPSVAGGSGFGGHLVTGIVKSSLIAGCDDQSGKL